MCLSFGFDKLFQLSLHNNKLEYTKTLSVVSSTVLVQHVCTGGASYQGEDDAERQPDDWLSAWGVKGQFLQSGSFQHEVKKEKLWLYCGGNW